MIKCKLTFFQTFNAMRIYLTSYFEKTGAADIAILLSGLKLDSSRPNWKEDLWTWDQAMFEDWMDGVNKTLKDLNIQENPNQKLYDEWTAFLCMKNYLQLLYEQIPFDDVRDVLKVLQNVKHSSDNLEWLHWLDCIQNSIKQEPYIIG